MSNPTTLQSRLVPFALSTDGVTYGNVVCKKAWDITVDRALVEDDSDCGHHVGAGAAAKNSIGFEIILNTTKNSGEYSSTEVFNFSQNGTLVYFKIQYTTTPATYYRQGQGYITNYKESAPVGGFITATGTLSVDGDIDTTP